MSGTSPDIDEKSRGNPGMGPVTGTIGASQKGASVVDATPSLIRESVNELSSVQIGTVEKHLEALDKVSQSLLALSQTTYGPETEEKSVLLIREAQILTQILLQIEKDHELLATLRRRGVGRYDKFVKGYFDRRLKQEERKNAFLDWFPTAKEEFSDKGKTVATPQKGGDVSKSSPGNTETTGRSYAKVATLSDLKVNTISWADLVEQDEEAIRLKNEIETSHLSLLNVIRSKEGLSSENRIEIPGDLEKTLPLIFRQYQIASELAKCKLVANPRITLNVARSDIWGDDEVARGKVLSTLYTEEGVPRSELVQIGNVSALFEFLSRIPGEETVIVSGPGRMGLAYVMSLFMRVYSEQVFSVPIAKQRNWWKDTGVIRKEIILQMSGQFGATAANCLVNAFDVLYRKFIRRVFLDNKEDGVKRITELASNLSKRLLTSGGGLMTSLFHTETRKKKVTAYEDQKRGPPKKVVNEVSYTAHVKPNISDGPKTAFEKEIVQKVNNALDKIASKAEDYDFGSTKFSSPIEWEESHKTWLDNLYNQVRIPSGVYTSRRRIVRMRILADRTKKVAEPSTATAAPSTPVARISNEEWIAYESSYIEEHEAAFEQETIKVLNEFLAQNFSKEEFKHVSTEEILNLLGA